MKQLYAAAVVLAIIIVAYAIAKKKRSPFSADPEPYWGDVGCTPEAATCLPGDIPGKVEQVTGSAYGMRCSGDNPPGKFVPRYRAKCQPMS